MMATKDRSSRNAKKCAEISRILVKEQHRAHVKKVAAVLKKSAVERSEEEKHLLLDSPEVVKTVKSREKTRSLAHQRKQEIEDPIDELYRKCDKLASAIKKAQCVVIYTGAGISTAASIPDYRGPNGVWTLLQQGKQLVAQDLSDAEPTYTHMAITALYQAGMANYVVSQNCDGLHMRSGLSLEALSEVHGNMYMELCKMCAPHRSYLRLFDVTERTALRLHKTGRFCKLCATPLRDTIVHFGEKGGLTSPYNWQEAADAVDEADLILCLGTSLKVLKRYPCLWAKHRAARDRPDIYIANLQWTPKDDQAVLKLNGRCDVIMTRVMEKLKIDVANYSKLHDPIFKLATPLRKSELKTTSRKILEKPEGFVCLKRAPAKRRPPAARKKSTAKRKRGRPKVKRGRRKKAEPKVLEIPEMKDETEDSQTTESASIKGESDSIATEYATSIKDENGSVTTEYASIKDENGSITTEYASAKDGNDSECTETASLGDDMDWTDDVRLKDFKTESVDVEDIKPDCVKHEAADMNLLPHGRNGGVPTKHIKSEPVDTRTDSFSITRSQLDAIRAATIDHTYCRTIRLRLSQGKVEVTPPRESCAVPVTNPEVYPSNSQVTQTAAGKPVNGSHVQTLLAQSYPGVSTMTSSISVPPAPPTPHTDSLHQVLSSFLVPSDGTSPHAAQAAPPNTTSGIRFVRGIPNSVCIPAGVKAPMTTTTQSHAVLNHPALPPGTTVSHPVLQHGTAVTHPALPPGTAVTHSALPPGTAVTHSALPPGTAVPHSALPPGTAVTHPALPPGTAVTHPALPPGTAVTHSALPPGTAVTHPALPPGTAVTHTALPLGTTVSVSHPVLLPGATVNHPALPPGTTVKHTALPPGTAVTHPALPPGTTVNHPALPPGTTVNHTALPPGTTVSHPSVPLAMSMPPATTLSNAVPCMVMAIDQDGKITKRIIMHQNPFTQTSSAKVIPRSQIPTVQPSVQSKPPQISGILSMPPVSGISATSTVPGMIPSASPLTTSQSSTTNCNSLADLIACNIAANQHPGNNALPQARAVVPHHKVMPHQASSREVSSQGINYGMTTRDLVIQPTAPAQTVVTSVKMGQVFPGHVVQRVSTSVQTPGVSISIPCNTTLAPGSDLTSLNPATYLHHTAIVSQIQAAMQNGTLQTSAQITNSHMPSLSNTHTTSPGMTHIAMADPHAGAASVLPHPATQSSTLHPESVTMTTSSINSTAQLALQPSHPVAQFPANMSLPSAQNLDATRGDLIVPHSVPQSAVHPCVQSVATPGVQSQPTPSVIQTPALQLPVVNMEENKPPGDDRKFVVPKPPQGVATPDNLNSSTVVSNQHPLINEIVPSVNSVNHTTERSGTNNVNSNEPLSKMLANIIGADKCKVTNQNKALGMHKDNAALNGHLLRLVPSTDNISTDDEFDKTLPEVQMLNNNVNGNVNTSATTDDDVSSSASKDSVPCKKLPAKRKSTSSPTVGQDVAKAIPGWFGKGLAQRRFPALKKRRKRSRLQSLSTQPDDNSDSV